MFNHDDVAMRLKRDLRPLRSDSERIHATYLEMVVAWYAIERWKYDWQGLEVPLYTDNEGVEYILQKGRTNSTEIMRLMRLITKLCIKHDIRLIPIRITTKDNTIADCLSRLDWKGFITALTVKESFKEFSRELTQLPDPALVFHGDRKPARPSRGRAAAKQ